MSPLFISKKRAVLAFLMEISTEPNHAPSIRAKATRLAPESIIAIFILRPNCNDFVLAACIASFLAAGIGCNSNGSTDSVTTDSSTNTTSTDTKATDTTSTMAAAPTKDTSMEADRTFLMEAASGGLMEVELGKYASTTAA